MKQTKVLVPAKCGNRPTSNETSKKKTAWNGTKRRKLENGACLLLMSFCRDYKTSTLLWHKVPLLTNYGLTSTLREFSKYIAVVLCLPTCNESFVRAMIWQIVWRENSHPSCYEPLVPSNNTFIFLDYTLCLSTIMNEWFTFTY